jgi:hypothetical protein
MFRSATVALLLLAGLSQAREPVTVEIPQLDRAEAKLDGVIEPGEYRASFTDPRTGVEVHWQADSFNLQVALRSPGQGWLAMGLGSGKMNGAVMILGFVDGEGNWTVQEHLGKAFFRHAPAEKPRLVGGKARLSGGRLVMEFVLPLSLSNGQNIAPGREVPFLLALHQDRGKLAKHSRKSSAILKLVRAPAISPEQGVDK